MSSVRWFFDLLSWKPSVGDLTVALSSIHGEERSRIEKFVYRRDALASLVGRLLTRAYCCTAAGLSWDRLDLRRDQNGKPYLKCDGNVKFNVSHQGKYVVLAGEASDRVESLGVDVMKQEYTGGKPVAEFFRLMEKNFARNEWTWIDRPSDHVEKTRRFFRLWTLKESYVKATGTGITVPLDEIEFTVPSDLSRDCFINDSVLRVASERQSGWSFQEMLLDSQHCVSVALRTSDLKNASSRRFEEISYNDIANKVKPIDQIDRDIADDILSRPFSPLSNDV